MDVWFHYFETPKGVWGIRFIPYPGLHPGLPTLNPYGISYYITSLCAPMFLCAYVVPQIPPRVALYPVGFAYVVSQYLHIKNTSPYGHNLCDYFPVNRL